MTQALAFIGLGIMGLPMAGHLLSGGHRLAVHTRTKSKAEPLLGAGAVWAESPADAARAADVVFICLPDTPDVEKVLLGGNGILHGARPGAVVVDHSTISPTATRRFAQALADRGMALLDAPVSGGDAGARTASLSIMVGGDPAAFARVLPLLGLMGKTITHCGPSGTGQLTKLTNQILVAGTLQAVAEAMAFAEKAGLDGKKTLDALAPGAAGSWQLSNLGPKMLARDYAPGFMIDLARKDLRLVVEEAQGLSAEVPAVRLVKSVMDTLSARGLGSRGTQAVYDAVVTTDEQRPK